MALGLVTALISACTHGPQLRAGDGAPDFSLPGSDGRRYRLADYRGRQVVVLAWFPKAFTGG
jgi:peroxiredoxin Q/BCP